MDNEGIEKMLGTYEGREIIVKMIMNRVKIEKIEKIEKYTKYNRFEIMDI